MVLVILDYILNIPYEGQQGLLRPGDGDLLLEKIGCIGTEPDGDGGVLFALMDSGMLDKLAFWGVNFLHIIRRDTPETADPSILGYCNVRL